MTTITKNWESGTGAVTINYSGSGSGTITITSDANNLSVARSMQIDIENTNGSPVFVRTVTIVQQAKSSSTPNFILADGKYLKLRDGGYFNVNN